MKNTVHILLPCLFLGLFFFPGESFARSTLLKMNKVEGKDTIELYCSFNRIPVYRTNMRNKRVDFILEDTVLKPEFSFFSADDKIVKILSQHKNKKTIISFFFRYSPQKFDISRNEKEHKLTISILMGNPYSTALPDFSSKLEGLTLLRRTSKDYSNPLIASPYAADWKSFFRLYESRVNISLPVEFTQPPFPVAGLLSTEKNQTENFLGVAITELAEQGLWDDIEDLLLERLNSEKDPDTLKKLALTYGDALAREGKFSDAFKQFYLLAEEYTDEEIGLFAKYLLALLRARFQDVYIAEYELRQLESAINPSSALAPYFYLSELEAALATEQLERMQVLLKKDDIALPPHAAQVRKLRQADYWYATGDLIKAYVGYQLLADSPLLAEKSYSLNGYCDTLYQQKQFREASAAYNSLANHIDDKNTLGLINYRKYMAELNFKPGTEMIDFFARIENTYPGTEAGFRGALKKTDLQLMILKDWSDQAILYYHALAQKAVTREAREEASFKEALVYSLHNNNIKSVELLMTFLRDFRNGKLFTTGQALLIDILPDTIREYVDREMYMEALVLAKKNRQLFIKNWIDISLLAELAQSYHKLGIYNESSKIYYYLISLSSEDQKEQYYLPLISAAYDHRSYDIVEDYADQYSYHYPNGTYFQDILFIRLKSLIAQELFEEAINLLPDEIPLTENFTLLAASLYFRINNYDKVISILNRPVMIDEHKQDQSTFMLAESFYRTGQPERAEKQFLKIPESSIHFDQSLFRLAEIAEQRNDRSSALNLYRDLVETGKNPLWVKMAGKELEYDKVVQ